jgi:predicted AAA+ superfamily ATPase
MALSNYERVGRALKILRKGLLPYIYRELKAFYKNDWWKKGVEPSLVGPVGLEAQNMSGTDTERLAALDIQALLVVMWDNWNKVFMSKLGHVGRSYVSELREVRNRWAHQQAFTLEDTYRAFDTMMRLLEMISAPEAESIRKFLRQLMRIRYEEETKRELKKQTEVATQTHTLAGLKPWREVATPHPDVAGGRYQQAEFAADLAQVITGEAEDEYKNPQEFYRRTYLTEGLSHLLTLALKRLSGNGGEPVVELQTNFGGGKTHSMIALYHLFSGNLTGGEAPGMEEVLQNSGVTQLCKANRAVLVGTKLNQAVGAKKPEGITVNTMWGEMAYQLGGVEGYSLVAENDQSGTSPGSDTLKELFDRYSPVLVLIDEWVAYARQLYHVDGLPAGSFEANMTFAQSLTEAAKRSSRTIVVASIPASDIEIGGEGGRAALERIRNTFGRIEAVWKPASAEESFAIVRRRLFDPITDFTARDAVCRAFAEMYRQNRGDFPSECLEGDYERRLKEAYPIHPELFDRLYQDWSTLERFQRTRGILRLMAAVIHDLWERQDRSLLIMPGTIPLDSPAVHFEITRHLPDGWGPIIDTDVDGVASKPLALDRDNPNLGRYSACRRVTRTIFVGSAPSVAAQRVRGIEEVRIKLGCAQPGEVPAIFGDALRRLSEQLTYLYGDGNRYWFDTRPSVNRIAADRAVQYRPEQVEQFIIETLHKNCPRGDFRAIHVAPASSIDVLDEQAVRLVVLGPDAPYSAKGEQAALDKAQKILDERGSSPRLYRNMLVFVAPDRNRLVELEAAVRQFLAWESIEADKENLNLDRFQLKQVELGLKNASAMVQTRMEETFIWLLVPTQENPAHYEVTWNITRLNGVRGSLPEKAATKLKADEQIITRWSPALLRMELDKYLWRVQPHINLKQLWDYFSTYLYLPRLVDTDVLLDTIKEGLTSKDFFAYAARVDENGRYLGLKFGTSTDNIVIDREAVLVKPEVAKEQIKKEVELEIVKPGPTTEEIKDPVSTPEALDAEKDKKDEEEKKKPKVKRFYGAVELDPHRVGRDAGTIAENIIQHLALEDGAEVTVTLDIRAVIPKGADEHTVRTVTENCRVLKFKTYGFEEE